MKSKIKLRNMLLNQVRSIAVLAACAIITAVITYVLYNYTQSLLKQRLQERLIAIVSTVSQQFEPNDILSIVNDENDLANPGLLRVVGILEELREANTDITYSYVMRRTDEPDVFAFVADADSLLTVEELDINENGVVDDTEVAPLPGDPFEVHEYPTLRDVAFSEPVASPDLEEDQWSVQLSAYAPIYDEEGYSIAIVGIDVVIENFKERTQATLLPFILFIFALVGLLTFLTLILLRYHTERVEIMRELDRQKDELLSIVSHQLATPITSLKWYLEMMGAGDIGKLSKEQSDHVKVMEAVSVNMVDLVEMILDVSRIQLGRMKADLAMVDVGEFFDGVLSVIEPKAKERRVKIITDIPKKLPTALYDARLLRMTLENLLSNAVKYTKEGGEVEFKVEVDGKMLRYTVKDNGIGIPKKDQDNMFTKLFRASNTGNIDGNGFGLYVAKGATEALDGTIRFISEEGKGTTFYVNLPIRTEEKKS